MKPTVTKDLYQEVTDNIIAAPVAENQAAYLQGWLSALQEDSKAIIWAAGKAARAADFILGRNYNDEE